MDSELFYLYMRDIQVPSFSATKGSTKINKVADKTVAVLFAVSLFALLGKISGEYAAEWVHEKVITYQGSK